MNSIYQCNLKVYVLFYTWRIKLAKLTVSEQIFCKCSRYVFCIAYIFINYYKNENLIIIKATYLN